MSPSRSTSAVLSIDNVSAWARVVPIEAKTFHGAGQFVEAGLGVGVGGLGDEQADDSCSHVSEPSPPRSATSRRRAELRSLRTGNRNADRIGPAPRPGRLLRRVTTATSSAQLPPAAAPNPSIRMFTMGPLRTAHARQQGSPGARGRPRANRSVSTCGITEGGWRRAPQYGPYLAPDNAQRRSWSEGSRDVQSLGRV